jgi:hypothetical protein
MASAEQSSSGFVTTTAEPGVGHSAASPFSNGTVRQHRYTPLTVRSPVRSPPVAPKLARSAGQLRVC